MPNTTSHEEDEPYNHPISMTKPPNPKLLSFFLQALVMFFVIVLFFLFVGIASVFIVHIRIASRNRFPRHHRHHSHQYEDDLLDENSPSGLSLDDLQKLPCCNYKSVLKSGSTRDCAVCLEGFREGEIFRILPRCQHVFHSNCIESWLNKASACPICRRSVVELNEYSNQISCNLRGTSSVLSL